jgi:acyl carrier protein
MDNHRTAMAVIAQVSKMEASTISPSMELVADLGLDSARALELLVELEDSLGIEIGDEDAAKLNTVGDILAYLDRVSPAGTNG